MATKRTKKTESSKEVLERWMESATKIDEEINKMVRNQWEPGCGSYITVGETYPSNFEKFYLEDLELDTEENNLTGYVVIEWNDDGYVGIN